MCHMLAPDFGKNDSSSRPQEAKTCGFLPLRLPSPAFKFTLDSHPYLPYRAVFWETVSDKIGCGV